MRATVVTLLLLAAAASARADDLGRGVSAIRKLDFQNHVYDSTCFGEITAQDGHFASDLGVFSVVDVRFGDVTGDGREDAIVRTACHETMAISSWTELVVFVAD